mgnify:CR=1 FL=1
MPVAPARHAGSRAHTLVSAHTFGVGVFRVFAWGRALLGLVVGVFAWWVAGLCSLFSCSRGCLRFLVWACLLGVVGRSVSRRPSRSPSFGGRAFGAHALVWA